MVGTEKLKMNLFLQVLTGEELRSDDPNGVANPSAEGVRGDTQSGEAERPLSDLEIEAIAAAEQAHAAAAAAAKVLVSFCAGGQTMWTHLVLCHKLLHFISWILES